MKPFQIKYLELIGCFSSDHVAWGTDQELNTWINSSFVNLALSCVCVCVCIARRKMRWLSYGISLIIYTIIYIHGIYTAGRQRQLIYEFMKFYFVLKILGLRSSSMSYGFLFFLQNFSLYNTKKNVDRILF
jgi:hypothetical protein